MHRRRFMQLSLRTAAAAGLNPLIRSGFAQTAALPVASDYRAIVCLFLSGGLDSNNLLVPCDAGYGDYAAARGPLTIQKGSLNLLGTASSGRQFGTHPSMPNLARLFNAKEAAFLANVGTLPYPVTKETAVDPSRLPINMYSHPAQIGEWYAGVTQSSASTGWGGRIADTYPVGNMPMVVSTAGYSLLGQGQTAKEGTASDGAAAVTGLNSLATLSHYMSSAEGSPSNDHIVEYVSDFQANFLGQTKVLSDAFLAGGGLRTTFPTTSIGQQMQAVVQMINGRHTHDTKRQIFICVDGGYDTHDNQMSQSSTYFGRLDSALQSFVAGLQEIGMYDNVALFSGSDFGRSLRSNATAGSDHAWGNHHLVIGGGVKGGDVYGTFPSLVMGGQDDLNGIGTWIPTTSSTQYLATMAGWLGVNDAALDLIFPERRNFPQGRLGLI